MAFGARIHSEDRDIFTNDELHIAAHYLDALNEPLIKAGWPNTITYKSHELREDGFILEVEAPASLKLWAKRIKEFHGFRIIDPERVVFALKIPFNKETDSVEEPRPRRATNEKLAEVMEV